MTITKEEKEHLEVLYPKRPKKEAVPSNADPADAKLEAGIEAFLRPLAEGLQVIVHKGLVTLSGTADDQDTKRNIGEAVERFEGVLHVTNHIRVWKK